MGTVPAQCLLHPGGVQLTVLVRGRVLGYGNGAWGDAVDLDVAVTQIEGAATSTMA